MGWFDEQIRQRKNNDNEVFSDSFLRMAGAVVGGRMYRILSDDRIRTKNAIDEILKFYHVKSQDLPDNITDVNEQLEYLCRPHGIMRRTVELEKGWYRDAIGALLAVKKDDGSIVALIPSGITGYSYTDGESGKKVRVTARNEDLFEKDAVSFYKPFPMRKLTVADLVTYMAGMVSVSDVVNYLMAMLAVTLVGRLLPMLNKLLYSTVLEAKNYQLLFACTAFIVSVTFARMLLSAVNTLAQSKVDTKINISVEAASMMRVLSLPASFFKKYSSGDLASRLGNISTLCSMLISSVVSVGLTAVFSLTYISQLFTYARPLVMTAIGILIATAAFSIISTFARMKTTKRRMELSAKEYGMSYAMISGVQKVKLSGSEKRAFARWAALYSEEAKLTYNPPMFLKINGVISSAIGLIGTLLLYSEASLYGVTMSDYIGFTMAYGYVSGAFMSLTGIAQTIASIKPVLDMVKPILDAEPEVSEGKQVITRLAGGIEINNVSFRYNDSMPNVIDDLTLKIRPGQYVAIVGKTGCGKSTLVRLLLGFEKPQKGAIYYDGKDIASIDLKSLRRKIGVVMQEGKLFQGDLFSNITISAPWLKLEDAWEAAELAGVADDIRSMPMQMFTMVSEGSGGISGGQRQRLMIARAVAPKPKILIFDEATSALDNITQKKVSESLDSLKCTRIVIAHRLSTIKHCDRIICLDGGHIIEDGTYDELIAKKGFFAELVARQRIDAPSDKKELSSNE